MMEKRTISQTGLTISKLGLGCMGMSEFYGTPNEAECIETLEKAIELGITHFDTADMYGYGDNEKLIAKILNRYRADIIIATKFGIVRDKLNPVVRRIDNSPEYIRSACEASLQRLKMDYIDLYYVHRVNVNTPIEETIAVLSELVNEGKIRYIGLSEASADIIRLAHKVHPITAIQSEYSIWTRTPEKEVIPICEELGIGFVAYSPLGRGFLTGKLKEAASLDEKDFRRSLPRFQEGNFQHNLIIVETLEKIANQKKCTVAQLALAWVLAQSDHITAIPGTKRRQYLEENIGAVTIKLNKAELTMLNKLIPPEVVHGKRYTQEMMKAFNIND